MTNTPTLSILIPTRNRARYLPHAIKSCLDIPSREIEVIVSNNCSTDDTLQVLHSFNDDRFTFINQVKPLQMHENWECLLNLANGRWVTFIGDDDAVLPYILDSLNHFEQTFPHIEAIIGSRAIFQWHAVDAPHISSYSLSYSNSSQLCDSKSKLRRILALSDSYHSSPQIYAGGLHRRSLINRVRNSQGGVYFKSLSPDSYSACLALLHTCEYLQVNYPLSWAGHSRSFAGEEQNDIKDRILDFLNLKPDSDVSFVHFLGSPFVRQLPRGFHFYESLISAYPLISPYYISKPFLTKMFRRLETYCHARGQSELVKELSNFYRIKQSPKPLIFLKLLSYHLTSKFKEALLRSYRLARFLCFPSNVKFHQNTIYINESESNITINDASRALCMHFAPHVNVIYPPSQIT